MTPALQKMVEAMAAEFERQIDSDEDPTGCAVLLGDQYRLDGHFDLEKVARAGLEAIRDPGAHAHAAGLRDRNDYGSVCNTWEAMITEILKETP